MKWNRTFLLVIVLLIHISCGLINKIPPNNVTGFSYKNKFKFENQIKMDGYYTWITPDNKVSSMYLFENGSCYIGSNEKLNINSECFKIREDLRSFILYWGFFIVNNDTLKVQVYDPTSLQRHFKYQVEEHWAKIKNDSTFIFFKRITPEKEIIILNQTYHFKNCLNKPDSMNIFLDGFEIE